MMACSACGLVNGFYHEMGKRTLCDRSHVKSINTTMTHDHVAKSITIEPQGHMMLNETIVFPNYVPHLLGFYISYSSRRFDIGNNNDKFYPDKSNTFPLYCVTNSGKKYSMFGEDFLNNDIRSYLCAIANYNKAKDTGKDVDKRYQELVSFCDIKSITPMSKHYINTNLQNVRWTRGLHDLYNISDSTLNQVISRKCVLYTMINELKECLNVNYEFDTNIVLQTALLYEENNKDMAIYYRRNQEFIKNVNYHLPTRKIRHTAEKQKDTYDMYDIINTLCPNNVDIILSMSNDITSICYNTLKYRSVNLDLFNKKIYDALKVIFIHYDEELASQFRQLFPKFYNQITTKLEDQDEVIPYVNNYYNNVKEELKMMIVQNKGLIDSIIITQEQIGRCLKKCNTKYAIMMFLIKQNLLSFDELIIFKHQISVAIANNKKQMALNSKEQIIQALKKEIKQRITKMFIDKDGNHLNEIKYVSDVTSRIINGNYSDVTCRWLYNKFPYYVKDVQQIVANINSVKYQNIIKIYHDKCKKLIEENKLYNEQTNDDIAIEHIETNKQRIREMMNHIKSMQQQYHIDTVDDFINIVNKYKFNKEFVGLTKFIQCKTLRRDILWYDLPNDIKTLQIIKRRLLDQDQYQTIYNKLRTNVYACASYDTVFWRTDYKYKHNVETTNEMIRDIQELTHYEL